jgi:hypothetical protein
MSFTLSGCTTCTFATSSRSKSTIHAVWLPASTATCNPRSAYRSTTPANPVGVVGTTVRVTRRPCASSMHTCVDFRETSSPQ